MTNHYRFIILGLYALAVTFFMLDGAILDGPEGWIWSIVFILFAIAPIAALCLRKSYFVTHGAAAVIIGGAGLWAFWYTVYIAPPDGQSALVFVFVPVYQLVAVALLTICLAIVSRYKPHE